MRGEDGTQHTLEATPEHPFWSPAAQRWVDLEDLEPGDALWADGARSEVVERRVVHGDVDVFNVEVDRPHNYVVVGDRGGVLVHNGGPYLETLSRAAGAADRGGLTKAGRPAQKHGDRADSVFLKATGSVSDKNSLGQDIVDGIHNDPTSTTRSYSHPRFGDVTDVVGGNGRGVRFDGQRNMIGLLEPPR
ncbi:MAG: polymorphic toxin-type HINT domain-containing protein [Myxococcota bacterium]